MPEHEPRDCGCNTHRWLAEMRLRYALRPSDDRPEHPSAADELDRFIVRWIRGEVDAT